MCENITPAQQWAGLAAHMQEVEVTEELLQRAREAFGRREVLFLHHLVAVAIPQLPTTTAALRAVRRGQVYVDGVAVAGHNAAAPEPGSILSAKVGDADKVPSDLEQRLQTWNTKSQRLEAKIRVLISDAVEGWAVVNKPAGMHCSPCFNTSTSTLQAYLPALLPPPLKGTHCSGPRVCHRLDFRVCGPVVTATSEEAMRAIKLAFEQRWVSKEYRAIVCGDVGTEGQYFDVQEPLDGEDAHTRVQVLRTVCCPHFGVLSELRLWPLTGRHQQLRRHCSEVLGTPIVNEERSLFEAAAPAWVKRHGSDLPPYVTRGGGTLFLQAVSVSIPARAEIQLSAIEATVDVSERFDRLLRTSTKAWNEGWRTDSEGKTCRVANDVAEDHGEQI